MAALPHELKCSRTNPPEVDSAFNPWGALPLNVIYNFETTSMVDLPT